MLALPLTQTHLVFPADAPAVLIDALQSGSFIGIPAAIGQPMQELIDRASYQNFVPVVDDKNAFIGIVTRRAIIKYCQQSLFTEVDAT